MQEKSLKVLDVYIYIYTHIYTHILNENNLKKIFLFVLSVLFIFFSYSLSLSLSLSLYIYIYIYIYVYICVYELSVDLGNWRLIMMTKSTKKKVIYNGCKASEA